MSKLRFTRMELIEVQIPFRFQFQHSLATRKEASNILVVLHTNTGHIGYGEVLPRTYLTGETLDSAWHDLAMLWWPHLRDLSFESRSPTTTPRIPVLPPDDPLVANWSLKPGTTRDFFNTLRPIYDQADHGRRTGSYAGLDIAAVDAWAKATGRPGCSLFGQPASRCALSAVIGGGSLPSVRRRARIFKWLGFQQFKLKVGEGNDLTRVASVRKIIGPQANLRLDANAGWDAAQAIAMIRKLKEHRITSVEQPIPAGAVQTSAADMSETAEREAFVPGGEGSPERSRLEAVRELARIQEATGVPVMADESLCTRADAEALARNHAARFWNVRLAKIGGFSGLLEMLRIARDHFIRLHLGVLVGETSCLAAAQRACLGLANFAHVEYGWPRVLLKADPFRGGPGGFFGIGKPLGMPHGLGVSLSDQRLKGITIRRESFS